MSKIQISPQTPTIKPSPTLTTKQYLLDIADQLSAKTKTDISSKRRSTMKDVVTRLTRLANSKQVTDLFNYGD